jgi:hypothetical protein
MVTSIFLSEARTIPRAEYLSDRGGGLFSNATQALKETTFTTEFKVAEGFLMRGEFPARFFESSLLPDGYARAFKERTE